MFTQSAGSMFKGVTMGRDFGDDRKKGQFLCFLPITSREYNFRIYKPDIRFLRLKLDLYPNFQPNLRNFIFYGFVFVENSRKNQNFPYWAENWDRGQVWVVENEYRI